MYSLPGLNLHLDQRDIPVDGSGHIRIADIGYNADSALLCQSSHSNKGRNWYLHPTKKSTSNSDRIISADQSDRGWHRDRGPRVVRLWRDLNKTAEEGVFTCNIEGDSNTPVSVGIYYHSESMITNTYSYIVDIAILSRL